MPRTERELIVDLLGQMKVPVLAASKCEEASGFLRPECNVSIVLTSVELSDGDWETVLQRVTRIRPNAQVIVCTEFPTPELCGKVFQRGASDLLMGPYDMEGVSYAVNTARDRQRIWHETTGSAGTGWPAA